MWPLREWMRPALVVSNDGFNRCFPPLTVLPLTRSRGKRRPVYGFEDEE